MAPRTYRASAHPDESHVVEDGIGPEQADIAARHHRSHVFVAEGQEDLADVETGSTERRVLQCPIRRVPFQVGATPIVGADARIQAERKAQVIAGLRRRPAYRQRRGSSRC